PERPPVLRVVLAPAACVVLPEPDLRLAGGRVPRIDRAPGEDVPYMPADAIREERLVLGVHGELDAGRVAVVHGELDAGRVAVDQLGCGGRPGPGEPGDGSGDDGNTTHSWPHLLIDGYPIRLELEPRSCAEMSL